MDYIKSYDKDLAAATVRGNKVAAQHALKLTTIQFLGFIYLSHASASFPENRTV